MHDLQVITAFNCALAKETENIDLPLDTATAGVKAVLEGNAFGAVYYVLEVDSSASSSSNSASTAVTETAAAGVASANGQLAGSASSVHAASDTAASATGSNVVVAQLMTMPEWSDWRAQVVWWVHSVYVHPEHRRAGHFKRLYRFIQQEARSAGAAGLKLYTDNDNARAHKTYEQLGMRSHCKVYEALDTAF